MGGIRLFIIIREISIKLIHQSEPVVNLLTLTIMLALIMVGSKKVGIQIVGGDHCHRCCGCNR